MAQVTFGEILQEARERKGYDLSTAARRLRIRPDILRAIEETDFARMPPRGYTRNMVNAYARLLGLNPTEITRLYLDEAYAYQVGRARSDVRPSGFDMGGTSRTRRGSGEGRALPREEPEERVPRQNAFGRTLYDDRTSYSRSDYGQRGGGVSGGRLYSEDRTHTSRHTALPNGQYTNFYAGPKAPSGVQSKLPFIIAGGVVLLVLVLVLVFAFGGNKGGDDVPAVPVTGLTDTTQGEEGEGSQEPAPAPEKAPESAKVVYEVASGQEAYLDVYDGDVITFGGTVSGPSKEEVDATGVWKLVTSNPSAVTVTVDGAKVEPEVDESIGVYTYTVDFPAILEKWKADHPTASTSGTTGTSGTDANAGSGTAA